MSEKQKVYVRLSVDAHAYWSEQTYCEEVFLPQEVWDEIKECMSMNIYIGGLDGKHSEVKGEIETELFVAHELEAYIPESQDGERLFNHIYEYLDEEKYDNNYLLEIQEEVADLFKAEEITIKIRKDQKDEVMAILKDYLI